MPATFVDAAFREWRIALTVGVLPRLRAVGFDLGRVFKGSGSLADAFSGDPQEFGAALWVLCEAQAAVLGVSPEQFAELLDGPTMFAAGDALAEAIVLFRQRPAVASALLARLPETTRRVDEAAVRLIETRMDARVAEMTREATAGAPPGGTSSATAGSSPGSSGSTPAP